MLKNCFSLPKLYFLRTSTCFNHRDLLEKYDKTVRGGLSKVCNELRRYSEYTASSAEMGGLAISSALLLALPAILAPAFGASNFLTTIFSETFDDVSFTKALEKWLSLTNEKESPLDGTQKNWTQSVQVKTAQDLRVGGNRSKERDRKSELVLRSTIPNF